MKPYVFVTCGQRASSEAFAAFQDKLSLESHSYLNAYWCMCVIPQQWYLTIGYGHVIMTACSVDSEHAQDCLESFMSLYSMTVNTRVAINQFAAMVMPSQELGSRSGHCDIIKCLAELHIALAYSAFAHEVSICMLVSLLQASHHISFFLAC